MALDKKQIALTVTGIIAGLALTYILWRRSQQADAATAANAAAQAAAQEEQSQQLDYTEGNLATSGSSGGTIYESTGTTQTSTTPPSTDDSSTNDVTTLINAILGTGTGSTSTIPANQLIPEIQVSDGTSSLSGIDTSAAEILGQAPPSTVTSTTSTGQTYGATTSPTPGSDSSQPVTATAIFSTGGGNPRVQASSLVN